MTEASDATPASGPATADKNGQLIVACIISVGLIVLGLGLVAAGAIMAWNGKENGQVWLGLGAIIGGLSNALQAPSGISNVVRAVNGSKG